MESTRSYLLRMLHDMARGYFILGEAYHNYHLSGFTDLRGALRLPDVGQVQLSQETISRADDDELAEQFDSLRIHLQAMQSLDVEMSEWLAKHVGLPPARGKKEVKELERRLKRVSVQAPGGTPKGPAWAMEPDYRAFAARSADILASLDGVLRKTIARLEQLQEQLRES